MSSIPRFEIESLIMRYQLEPELKDIYVEGEFDREIIQSLTSHDKDIIVYSIDSVNVPADALAKRKMSSGNKQRVITLAEELSVVESKCEYRCLVDQDLDHWLNRITTIKNLSWTEYTSLELYFYSEEFISDILIKAARCKLNNWDEFYHSFTKTLLSLYAIRLTESEMSLNAKWFEPDKELSIHNDVITFDEETYIKKILISNKKSQLSANFIQKFNVWKKTNCDPRLFIRGHDFTYMLQWAVKHCKGIKNFQDEKAISRLFVLLYEKGKQVLNVL
jgi:hypothetical protein